MPTNQPTNNGVILWRGPSRYDGREIIVIATGLIDESLNGKTGDTIQVYILDPSIKPTDGRKTGLDSTICGSCPFAGGKGCYVNVGQGPRSVWEAYHRGRYPVWNGDVSLFAPYSVIRWGAYGDPVLIPYHIVRDLSVQAGGWLGYTHAWREQWAAPYMAFFMASTESEEGYKHAKALNYRCFDARERDGEIVADSEVIECLAYTHGLQCDECGKCNGTLLGGPDVAVKVHGSKWKAAQRFRKGAA